MEHFLKSDKILEDFLEEGTQQEVKNKPCFGDDFFFKESLMEHFLKSDKILENFLEERTQQEVKISPALGMISSLRNRLWSIS